jgi:hypothetical protein
MGVEHVHFCVLPLVWHRLQRGTHRRRDWLKSCGCRHISSLMVIILASFVVFIPGMAELIDYFSGPVTMVQNQVSRI